ncbi:Na+/H+ antiporter subunit E [Novosphingobium sp. M1R2S20]|uniref:Na+/H+ antiporter subunit E n=1 Tax=Novosphingobium rhizovicinum TaxID=3228928 RepID=A0ABV3REV6_9SPHN
MRRWFRYPLMTLGIFLMWLLLTQSFSPGQILLGIAVALIASAGMSTLRASSPRVRNWSKLAQLAAFVAVDVIRSNVAVAKIALSPSRDRHSAFIRLQLELREPHALTLLALILTATPGTAWVQYSRLDGALLIHVFDLVDEETWIHLIKARYERLLLEAFEP